VHSHDACDGNPYVNDRPNEPCLQNFRRAVCRAHLDALFLTEHDELISRVSFDTVMQRREGDERITRDGATVGYSIRCDDGSRTMIFPGAENELMPIGLTRHPDMLDGSLSRAYHANDAAGVQRFRAAGALVAIPHVEQRPIEELRTLAPDLVEVYNIHANIDPRLAPIASPEFNLGQALVNVLRFQRGEGLEPDLAFLAVFAENTNDLGKWARLWSEGRGIPGVAGSDAHENAIPGRLGDGERGDSYRRVFRWFSNHVLVRGEVTRASLMASLAAGRSYVAFEAFGSPVGYDFYARTRDGMTHDMGARVSMAEGPELMMHAPTLHTLPAGAIAPTVEMRLLRAEGNTWRLVERYTGTALSAELRHSPTMPGAYRAEVRIVPEHARRYLPNLEGLVREVPWVYGNPIRVE
jgi:hypothetical protein